MRIEAQSQSPPAAQRDHCPRCAGRVLVGEPNCPGCGIWLAGPHAAELWWIEGELRRIDTAKAWLLNRKDALLSELVDMAQASACGVEESSGQAGRRQVFAGPSMPTTARADGPAPAASRTPQTRPELSGRTVARLLLGAGVVLVVIAANVFTVANWSKIDQLGRCVILLGVTAVVLVAPSRLRRRTLHATAESVAAIGLALMIADAYLGLRLVGGLTREPFVMAATCAALAALWAAYGMATGLRFPRLAAIAAAQLPGLITTVALVRVLGWPTSALAGPMALALVLTSAADLLASCRASSHGRRAEALTSSIAATVAWAVAVLLALHAAVSPTEPGALWMSGVLIGAGAIGLCVLPRSAVAWMPGGAAAAISGALLAIGVALPAAAALPPAWRVAAFATAGAVVAGVALARARQKLPPVDDAAQSAVADGQELSPASRGVQTPGVQGMRLAAAGSAAILGAAGLIKVPLAAAALFPLRRLTEAWSGPARPQVGAAHVALHLLQSGALATPAVLALVSIACWLAPLPRRLRLVAPPIAALAAGSVPAAVGLTGWLALVVPTAAAAIMIGAGASAGQSSRLRDGGPSFAIAATCSGIALTASAVLWSLRWPVATMTELAVLTVIFCLAAALTSSAAQLAAGCALATATGLAWAVPLANGWPARSAAFAVMGVAVVAAAMATLLRNVRAGHALVLDVGACGVVLFAAGMAAQQMGTFAVLAAIAALSAGSTAWLRAGRRRLVALCAAASAALVAVAIEARPVAQAWFRPYAELSRPWHGYVWAAGHSPGLGLAVVVVSACAAAMVIAAGAWRGGRASLDAVAFALAVVAAPAGLAGGLSHGLIVGLLLAVALALTGWTSASQRLAPAGAALAAASLALAWALAAPRPTLIVLSCLSVAYPVGTWRCRRTDVRVAAACLSVLSAAALAESAALAAGWPARQAGLAVLGVAACAHAAAAWLGAEWRSESRRSAAPPEQVQPVMIGIEATAWLAVVVGTAQCLSRPGPASLALAISGVLAVAVGLRGDRRPALWVGLALCDAAWSVWLFATGVSAPEPYAVPAGAALIAYGWHLARRVPPRSSWLSYGPGLAILLVPSLTAVWHGHGWLRPLLLGAAAAGITLTGARGKLQAPLLIGAAVTVLDAGHELAPEIRQLAQALPSWLPIAIVGAILLWSGATYEARLRNLSYLRDSLAAMR
jgi:hypothetical protein